MEENNPYGDYKDVESDFWKPKEGEVLEGILVNKVPSEPGWGGLGAYYQIETLKGIKLVWGTTVLDERMKLVDVADKIRITYIGRKKNRKGQPLHIWKVEHAKRIITTDTLY